MILEMQRTFTVIADEQAVRTRLLDGMRRLGFKLISEAESELQFVRGSAFASEPNHRMYVTVRFDLDNRHQLTAVLGVPSWLGIPHNGGLLFDMLAWTGVDEYYDSVLSLVEQISISNDKESEVRFLKLSKRVGRNMILAGLVPVILVLTCMLALTLVPSDWSWWINLYAGLILLVIFLIRIGVNVYGYTRIKTFDPAN